MITYKSFLVKFFKLTLCLIFIFNLSSCGRKPDVIIDGKPYYITSRCLKDTTYTEFCYHYGISWRGKLEWHWGEDTKYECLKSVSDTVEIK